MNNNSNAFNGFWDGFFHILGVSDNPTRNNVHEILETDSCIKIKKDFKKVSKDYKSSLTHLKKELSIEF